MTGSLVDTDPEATNSVNDSIEFLDGTQSKTPSTIKNDKSHTNNPFSSREQLPYLQISTGMNTADNSFDKRKQSNPTISSYRTIEGGITSRSLAKNSPISRN